MMEDTYVLELAGHKFSDLHLCFCGYEKCRPGHSYGPAIRPNYILHFIAEGRGIYRVDGTTYHLEAGQGFLIEPGVQTYYEADPEEPWTYFWIGFDGKNAAECLRDVGLGSHQPVCRCTHTEELLELVRKMLEHNTCTIADQFYLQGALCHFFSLMASEQNELMTQTGNGENFYIRKAIEFVQGNYFNPIRVTDIADYVCINRSYLYTLFRKHLDTSPQEYLAKCRIARAADLLTTTELPVATVAHSCGYEDAIVFSKNFKERMGMNPSAWRAEHLRRNRREEGEKR